jgi:peroxiredoxin
MMRTIPTDTMPALEAGLAGGGTWRLAAEHARTLELIVFYHGLHCADCGVWLGELHRLLPEFERLGVAVIALSCDSRDRAEQAASDWNLPDLRIGYELDHEDARKAGLYLSEGRGPDPGTGMIETRVFTEPAVLAVTPEGILYAAWVQSSPHARPHLSEILAALERAIAAGLPEPYGSA